MSLAQFIGNESIKAWLRRAVKQERIPGAIVFSGPVGVGKRTFALELAKMLNCTQLQTDGDNCDHCTACRRIDMGQFADVSVIVPDGQFIKIDQVRGVTNEIYYQPFEGRYRVYIFEEAEKLREQAANALLKTLEEPPATAILILVTANVGALLPTIRSRTIQLRFAPLPATAMQSQLLTKHPRPAMDAQLLVKIANGSIGQALKIDLSQYREQRKECLELLHLLLQPCQALRLIKAAEYFGHKERSDFENSLHLFLILLRDLLCLKLSLALEVTNVDILHRLEALVGIVEIPRLITLSEQLNELQRNLVRNLNKQLALEAIFLNTFSPAPN